MVGGILFLVVLGGLSLFILIWSVVSLLKLPRIFKEDKLMGLLSLVFGLLGIWVVYKFAVLGYLILQNFLPCPKY